MSENCTHDCGSCGEECGSRQMNPADFLESPHQSSSIKKVIGVVSGKGGVGKSLVTSMLAVQMCIRDSNRTVCPYFCRVRIFDRASAGEWSHKENL